MASNRADVSINVKPDVMFDDKLDISVTGLAADSKVTLRLYLKQEKAEFDAHGHYIADSNGRIRLNEEPSVGGTYYGLEPMGLFWSLQPLKGQKLGTFYHHTDITKPDHLILTVHHGHLNSEQLVNDKPVAEATIKRHFMADDVERIPIRHGRLRGTVYKPKGAGPFPGVLHVYGLTTVIWDHLACCLASYGFAVFHILYIWHEQLPKSVKEVELEYFFEAIDWFSDESYVTKGGIQAVGNCVAGVTVLLLASLQPDKVVSVVVVNSLTFIHEPAMKFQGKTLPHLRGDQSKLTRNSNGTLNLRDGLDPNTAPEEAWIKVENIRQILFIEGDDDHAFQGLNSATLSIRRLQALGLNNYKLVQYPGAGHLIDLPYLPVITTTCWGYTGNLQELKGAIVYWGGKRNAHARAEEDSWRKMQEFLLKNATNGLTKSPAKSQLNGV